MAEIGLSESDRTIVFGTDLTRRKGPNNWTFAETVLPASLGNPNGSNFVPRLFGFFFFS